MKNHSQFAISILDIYYFIILNVCLSLDSERDYTLSAIPSLVSQISLIIIIVICNNHTKKQYTYVGFYYVEVSKIPSQSCSCYWYPTYSFIF